MAYLNKRNRGLRRIACAVEVRRKFDEAEFLRRQANIQVLLTRIEEIERSSTSSAMLGSLGAASAVKWIAKLRAECGEQQAGLEALRVALVQLFRQQRLAESLGEAMSREVDDRAKVETLSAVTERESVTRFAQDIEE